MLFTKLRMMSAAVVAAGAAVTSVAVLAHQRSPQRFEPEVTVVEPKPAATLPAPVSEPVSDGESPREAELIVRSATNLRRIAAGIHAYAQVNDLCFPPWAIQGADGKPLLSWRVAILPYIDQEALYKKFHLDEPWDSPNNKALLDEMPDVYAPVAHKDKTGHSTHYQVFAGPGALFAGPNGMKLVDIKDGTSMTVMTAEAAKPVPWTKPEDLPFDASKPLPQLGGQVEGGFCAGFVDGSARFINRNVDPKVLKALITPNGGERIAIDQF